MTDAQWAERITALARDKVKVRLSAFESDIKAAVNRLTNTRGYQRELEHQTLTWLLGETRRHVSEGTDVTSKEWLTRIQTREEEAIRAEMLAKLDIFGQLRKAAGEDWEPAKSDASQTGGLDDIPF